MNVKGLFSKPLTWAVAGFILGAICASGFLLFHERGVSSKYEQRDKQLAAEQLAAEQRYKDAVASLTANFDRLKKQLAAAEQAYAVGQQQLVELRGSLERANGVIAGYQKRNGRISELMGRIVADTGAAWKLHQSSLELIGKLTDGLEQLAKFLGASEQDIRTATGQQG